MAGCTEEVFLCDREAKAHVKALLIAQIIAAVNRAANYVREPFSSHIAPPRNYIHS